MEKTEGWYVLYVPYRHEKKVFNELMERDLEAFHPLTTTLRKWSDRTKKVQTPLFPRYVFVNIKSKKDFHNALTVESPCSYVRFGDRYGQLFPEEINQIKLIVEGSAVSDVEVNNELPKLESNLKLNLRSVGLIMNIKFAYV